MLPINDMFVTATKQPMYGIEGYHIEKKYVGYNNESSKIKKAELKRGSYL